MGPATAPQGASRSSRSESIMISLPREERPCRLPMRYRPDKLARLIGTTRPPVILDVRSDEDFAADPRLLPSAIRADDRALADVPSLPAGPSIVLCQAGHRRSQGTAAWLRAEGRSAEHLEGGFEAWQEAGLPLINPGTLPTRDAQGRTVWGHPPPAQDRPHPLSLADPPLCRSACGDPVRCPFRGRGRGRASQRRALRHQGRVFSHRGDLCSFDVMPREFGPPFRPGTGWPPSCGAPTPLSLIRRPRRRVCLPPRACCPCMSTI